jgi:glycyl-tRNA synthetase
LKKGLSCTKGVHRPFYQTTRLAAKKKKGEEENSSLPFKMTDLIELCKRRGFIFQSSEIYSGMAGFFDYGPLGVELKTNIKNLWWKEMVQRRDDIVGLDSSIIGSPAVWQASGHVAGFSDPMVDCKESKQRFRADQVFWGRLETESGEEASYVTVMESDQMLEEATKFASRKAKKLGIEGPYKPLILKDLTEAEEDIYAKIPSPATGEAGSLTAPRAFNLMFQTSVGAMSDASSVAYLRPETAQGIFINFQNVQRTGRMKVPFGIAQIGKAFRNEITPRNYIFRSREFEQMEIEYFIRPDDDVWENCQQDWIEAYWQWLLDMGLKQEYMSKEIHDKDKLAHYARACTDITFTFPFGTQELMGIAARGCYDLTQHEKGSGKTMEYFDEAANEKYVPHVIEPSIGVDRLVLAILSSAYEEDVIDGEKRTVLKFAPSVAPIKAAVFPLVKNKPEIMAKAKAIYDKLKQRWMVDFDVAGAIGRRYRRADEAGTPFCITIDYDTLENDSVTVRIRDSTEQKRMPIDELSAFLSQEIDGY